MKKPTRCFPVLFACLMWSVVGFAEEKSDGYTELAEAVKLAQQSGRPIFLQVSTTWCGWCKTMDRYLATNEPVKAKLAGKYQHCKIILDKDSRAGVFSTYPSIQAVPHIFILDKNGDLLHSQHTGALEKDGSYDTEKFMKLLMDWGESSAKVEKMRQTYEGELKPAAEPEGLKEGLLCKFHEGKWSKLPDFSKLEPQEKSVVAKVDAHKYNSREFVGVRFSGLVRIEKAGEYHVRLASNDGSRLKLAGKTVVDNDGLHLLKDKYIRIELEEGYYPFEVGYFRNGGNYGLIFSFVSAEDASVPLKYYHVPKK